MKTETKNKAIRKERLFFRPSIFQTNGGGYLKDASGFSLGYFDSFLGAENWCKENGYEINLAGS
jgi:hypothetical protein